MKASQGIIGALALTTVLAVPLDTALAQEVDAALERLKSLVESQGATIEWGEADISGDDVELVDVRLGSGDHTVPIGNVSLSGISEVAEGFHIEEISLPSYTMTDPVGTVDVEGVAITGVILPSEGQEAAYGGFLFYETADVARIAVTVKDKQVFTMNDMHVQVTPPEGDAALGFTGGAESFTADLSSIEDPTQKAVIQALGYEQLSGRFDLAGSWDPADGRMTLSQYDLTVSDAGTLGFNFDVAGYTPELIAALQEISQKMAENPDQDSTQQQLAMLGLMQQLTLHGAEIAFADDGLTENVLGFVAEQQGAEPSDIANQAKAVLPFALAQLNNPELTKMVTEAVSAFLDDPQSLSIRAEPASPVPFALIMAAAAAPQELPKTLGVTVTANE